MEFNFIWFDFLVNWAWNPVTFWPLFCSHQNQRIKCIMYLFLFFFFFKWCLGQHCISLAAWGLLYWFDILDMENGLNLNYTLSNVFWKCSLFHYDFVQLFLFHKNKVLVVSSHTSPLPPNQFFRVLTNGFLTNWCCFSVSQMHKQR